MDVVAIPLDGAPPTVLASVRSRNGGVPSFTPVAVRPDGSAVAFALSPAPARSRLALVDLSSGRIRWLTDHVDGIDGGPAWSPDGNILYYGRYDAASGDKGVWRVAPDGTELPPLVRKPPFGSFTSVSRATPDAVLIGADEFNGPTVWARDLQSDREVSFGAHNSGLLSWRATRPRGLVSVATNIVAPGAGYLALWDLDGTTTTIFSRPVAGGDFDPAGSRIVVAASDPADQRTRLIVMTASGQDQRVLEGTEDARSPKWVGSQIVYSTFSSNGPNKVLLISATGGLSRVLYSTSGSIGRVEVIKPTSP